MLEITLEEVRAGYAKCGLKPMSGGFRRPWDGPVEECCPLTALAALAGKDIQDEDFGIRSWAEEIYGEFYANDFWKGVDGREIEESTIDSRPGYIRGREIAQALGI